MADLEAALQLAKVASTLSEQMVHMQYGQALTFKFLIEKLIELDRLTREDAMAVLSSAIAHTHDKAPSERTFPEAVLKLLQAQEPARH